MILDLEQIWKKALIKRLGPEVMQELTIAIAALAGLGSFLAPCILPVIPAFLAYISGTTITELQRNNGTINLASNRLNVLFNTIFFVIGFSAIVVTFKDSAAGIKLASFLNSDWNYYFLLFITLLTIASGIAYIFESNTPVKQTNKT